MDSQSGRIVTFGEVMLRLSPPGNLRFEQASSFDVFYGGGEANVAVSLARLGQDVEYVTRLPAGPLGSACVQSLRKHGVGTAFIVVGGDRLGIYFLEKGAGPRPSHVVYDRAESAFARIEPGMVDWADVFKTGSWFHWTGITPAVSESAAAACLEAVRYAKKVGVTVSCDLNYRKKLWKWGRPAGDVMAEMVALCDCVIGNEADMGDVFGILPVETDVTTGEIDGRRYELVCRELSQRFPKLRTIAITLRGSYSADHNSWSAVCWNGGDMLYAPIHQIHQIRDRVGGGDSFAAGLIYGIQAFGENMARALEFAVAASCLKHTIQGDANLVTLSEIEQLMDGDASGRISR